MSSKKTNPSHTEASSKTSVFQDQALHKTKVLVLGAGNFGTCLAQHLVELGHQVVLWTRSPEIAASINEFHKNPKYLSTITLSERLRATTKIDKQVLSQAAVVVVAIPTQALREVLQKIKPFLTIQQLLVSASKGIEMNTLQLPSGIFDDVLGKSIGDLATFLSGPSFAIEIAMKQPTAVSVAGRSQKTCLLAQKVFHAAHFRAYTSNDPTGLEVAGAMKNVIAIASGASAGFGFEMNSRAALITRGLAEITRVGVALGSSPLTFTGLGGIGDLYLTCSSEKSRNFTVGFRLGRGESLAAIQATMASVAEGVPSAKAAYELTCRLKVSAPITHEVYRVLYDGKPIKQAIMDLLTREAKPEVDEMLYQAYQKQGAKCPPSMD